MMFYSMIEMGIAVVAGCLPTIWPLVNKISLENMVRSVRSALSLESLRESLGRGSASRGRSGVDASKWHGSGDEEGSKTQLAHGVSHEEHRPGHVQGQDRFVKLNRSVEVMRSPAEEGPQSRGLELQDLDVRTVTQVSSTAR